MTFTSASLAIPVSGGKLMLGTWQEIYLYRHRTAQQSRTAVVTLIGELG